MSESHSYQKIKSVYYTSITMVPWKSSVKLQIVVSITPDNLNLATGLFYVLANNLSGVIRNCSGLGTVD
jgi:hypothetical protein